MRRSSIVAVVWVSALGVAACSPSGAQTTAPPSLAPTSPPATRVTTSPTPTPSPIPTPSPTSTLNPDQQAAFDAHAAVLDLWWKTVQDPKNADTQAIADVGTEGGSGWILSEIRILLANDERAGGTPIHRAWQVSPLVRSPRPEVTVRYCSDNKEMKLIDASTGQEKDFQHLTQWNTDVMRRTPDGQWRMASSTNVNKPC